VPFASNEHWPGGPINGAFNDLPLLSFSSKKGVINFGINVFYGPCRKLNRVANALAALEAALPVKFFTRRLCVIFRVPPAIVFLRIFLI
jgi:hypothetical protein